MKPKPPMRHISGIFSKHICTRAEILLSTIFLVLYHTFPFITFSLYVYKSFLSL